MNILTYFFENNQRATWDNTGNQNILAIYDYWLVNSSYVINHLDIINIYYINIYQFGLFQ